MHQAFRDGFEKLAELSVDWDPALTYAALGAAAGAGSYALDNNNNGKPLSNNLVTGGLIGAGTGAGLGLASHWVNKDIGDRIGRAFGVRRPKASNPVAFLGRKFPRAGYGLATAGMGLLGAGLGYGASRLIEHAVED
jgi:hypothetical protein